MPATGAWSDGTPAAGLLRSRPGTQELWRRLLQELAGRPWNWKDSAYRVPKFTISISWDKEHMMSVLVKLFFNLAKELMKGCRRLNRWAEEHYDLIETEAVAVNGPPDGWTYSIGLMSPYHM